MPINKKRITTKIKKIFSGNIFPVKAIIPIQINCITTYEKDFKELISNVMNFI